jgi:hypothetical protein
MVWPAVMTGMSAAMPAGNDFHPGQLNDYSQ